MPASTSEDDDRRRHRRVFCGGEARIALLPSDGALYFGRLRDLSMGGICVDMPCPLDVGVRAELIVRIQGLSFRTLGQVKTLERSRTGMEFVHLTALGKQMLEEFLESLQEKQKAIGRLRSGRVRGEAELTRELKSAGIGPAVLGSGIPLIGSPGKSEAVEPASRQESVIEPVEALVRIDVFG